MRLRELQAPIRFARHNDPSFCIEALGRLPEVTRDLSPDQHDDLLALISELHARTLRRRKAKRRRRAAGVVRPAPVSRSFNAKRTPPATPRPPQKELTRIDIPSGASVLQSAVNSSLPDDLPSVEQVVRMTQPPRSRPDAKVALYDFFVNQCGLEKNDAEVRVGKIVNHILGLKVAVIEQPRSRTDERKGSEAVRKAVSRRRTSDKSRRNSRKS